jgi:undecaprenyl diphosphate synthase
MNEIRNPKSEIRSNSESSETKPKTIPAHIAIIMDGNGRWATQKNLPRSEGHRRGADSLKKTIKACMEAGVKYLTVYAFSTENWKRPEGEVNFLMQFLSFVIDREIDELKKGGVKMRFFGRIFMLPAELQKKISAAEAATKNNTAFDLNIMLSYGARAEIVDAVRSIVNKGIKADAIDEDAVSKELYMYGIPDPDLLIRTAGEMRVSNFLLWQIAYSEIFVTQTLWPDFGKKDLLEAIESYNDRVRKFGGVNA